MEIAALIIAIAAILGLIALWRHVESLDDVKDELVRELSREVDNLKHIVSILELEKFERDNEKFIKGFVKLMKYEDYNISRHYETGDVEIHVKTGKVLNSWDDYEYDEWLTLTFEQLQKEHKKVLELKEKLCDNKCSKKGAKKK